MMQMQGQVNQVPGSYVMAPGRQGPGGFQATNANQDNMSLMNAAANWTATPGPPPPEKKAIKVQLRGREHGFYSNMFSIVDPNDTGKVGGKEGVAFFRSSGIAVDKLKEIWGIAAASSIAFLTRDEFYVALRLIAYAQNGTTPSAQSVLLDIEAPLPVFDGGRPAPAEGAAS
jgi:hypothetical protein